MIHQVYNASSKKLFRKFGNEQCRDEHQVRGRPRILQKVSREA
jgi:hypothetical protein